MTVAVATASSRGIAVITDAASYAKADAATAATSPRLDYLADGVTRIVEVGHEKVVALARHFLVVNLGRGSFFDIRRFPLHERAADGKPLRDAQSDFYTPDMFDTSERGGRTTISKLLQLQMLRTPVPPHCIEDLLEWLIIHLTQWHEEDRLAWQQLAGHVPSSLPDLRLWVAGRSSNGCLSMTIVDLTTDGRIGTTDHPVLECSSHGTSRTVVGGLDNYVLEHEMLPMLEDAAAKNYSIFDQYVQRFLSALAGDEEPLSAFAPVWQEAYVTFQEAVVLPINFGVPGWPLEAVPYQHRSAYIEFLKKNGTVVEGR